ncbi:MAG: DUF3794 domain-containing protein [Tepidibacter sp.]|jgi:hypothetical protein|uniref:DUF3794 domain-containing protein n=1 Tax=Tepidibacter sp. TaxID=2529387 RepID=UPI0025F32B8A|nr:DUF3794 domain-containing protein [Tepidibacter sp.]MCT4508396.1 DUF3794 domain-containing protein [Tepidibacter sp.]
MSQSYINKDLIDIVGLCDTDAIDLSSPNNLWTQISVPESLTIPEQKPDIEQINSVKIKVNIIKKKIIVTPDSNGENEEGKKVTGRKLIIEGELVQAVTYTADVPEQTLHTAHFIVPFSAFIVIPRDTPLDTNYEINACIEDVFIKSLCSRRIFKNVTLLLQAIPTLRTQCPSEC